MASDRFVFYNISARVSRSRLLHERSLHQLNHYSCVYFLRIEFFFFFYYCFRRTRCFFLLFFFFSNQTLFTSSIIRNNALLSLLLTLNAINHQSAHRLAFISYGSLLAAARRRPTKLRGDIRTIINDSNDAYLFVFRATVFIDDIIEIK